MALTNQPTLQVGCGRDANQYFHDADPCAAIWKMQCKYRSAWSLAAVTYKAISLLSECNLGVARSLNLVSLLSSSNNYGCKAIYTLMFALRCRKQTLSSAL